MSQEVGHVGAREHLAATDVRDEGVTVLAAVTQLPLEVVVLHERAQLGGERRDEEVAPVAHVLRRNMRVIMHA